MKKHELIRQLFQLCCLQGLHTLQCSHKLHIAFPFMSFFSLMYPDKIKIIEPCCIIFRMQAKFHELKLLKKYQKFTGKKKTGFRVKLTQTVEPFMRSKSDYYKK